MSKIVFKEGFVNTISDQFSGPAEVIGFNLKPDYFEQDENGLTTAVECGDYVTFEYVLNKGDYNVDCSNEISSSGVRASTPLLDECGEPVKLTACNNAVIIDTTQNVRAIYHGDGRMNAIVTAN